MSSDYLLTYLRSILLDITDICPDGTTLYVSLENESWVTCCNPMFNRPTIVLINSLQLKKNATTFLKYFDANFSKLLHFSSNTGCFIKSLIWSYGKRLLFYVCFTYFLLATKIHCFNKIEYALLEEILWMALQSINTFF